MGPGRPGRLSSPLTFSSSPAPSSRLRLAMRMPRGALEVRSKPGAAAKALCTGESWKLLPPPPQLSPLLPLQLLGARVVCTG